MYSQSDFTIMKALKFLLPCICIIIFTYLGVTIRLALTVWSELSKDTLLPKLGAGFFLPNIFGSFIMGIAVPMADHFRDRSYWHIGITTGFCGSCTTFSTWQKITADLMISGRIVDSVVITIATFCTSYMALVFGRHVGKCVSTCIENRSPRIYTVDQTRQSKIHDRPVWNLEAIVGLVSIVILNLALLIGIFLDPILERSQWWVAMALAPFGSLTRYGLSLQNKNYPQFPIFTFLINVCASVIAMIILVIQKFIPTHVLAAYDFWVMIGIGVGLLGSLSTVSTFVNEIYKFNSTNSVVSAYRYGLASILVSQIICMVIGCAKFAGDGHHEDILNRTSILNATVT